MTNIFVGNLSYETSQEDLEAAFNEFGAVERVNIVRDRDTGQPRGFAFVEMTNRNEASNAIAGLNGRNMNGRDLNVNEARPREERSGGGLARQKAGTSDHNGCVGLVFSHIRNRKDMRFPVGRRATMKSGQFCSRRRFAVRRTPASL